MSKFVEKVTALIQRLTGKAPDEAATKEITQLETELAGDNAKAVETLTETVKGLEGRLEKIEKGEGKTDSAQAAGDDASKKVGELTDTVKKLQERLDAVEKSSAKSHQPGEGTGTNTTETRVDMNKLIRSRLGK